MRSGLWLGVVGMTLVGVGLLSKSSKSSAWTVRILAVCPEEISFADEKHGWLRDTRNYLYSTTDGGNSWVMLP
jgi:photosystem II stability/assembly factor-like uncharacterized protein